MAAINRVNWRMTSEMTSELRLVPVYNQCMFECRKGWYALLYDLGQKISSYCSNQNIDLPRIQQIKEKFGTLRFYYHFQHDITDEQRDTVKSWVNDAEKISETTCEYCGEEGILNIRDGVWEVSCKEHQSETSMTFEVYKKTQDEIARNRRVCSVCGINGAEIYHTGTEFITLCDSHKGDFITEHEYYEQRHYIKKPQ